MNGHVVHNRRIRRYEHVHRSGAALATLDVINSGFLKSTVSGRDGSVQVTRFSMRGDLIGLDAIGSGVHQCDTIALEDAHLCGIEFTAFERLVRDIPALQHQFHKAMGAEISRDYDVMLLLGAMRAEERVAIFLLNLSRRFAAHGCSAVKFRLPMQRQEIGNYLGLKPGDRQPRVLPSAGERDGRDRRQGHRNQKLVPVAAVHPALAAQCGAALPRPRAKIGVPG